MMLKKLAVALLSLQLVTLHAMDASRDSIHCMITWNDHQNGNNDKRYSLIPFTLEKQDKIIVEVPEELELDSKDSILLGDSFRKFYDSCHDGIDIRPIEAALINISNLRKDEKTKVLKVLQNFDLPIDQLTNVQWPDLFLPLQIHTAGKMIYKDTVAIRKPKKNIQQLESHFMNCMNNRYQGLVKTMLFALLSPDFSQEKKEIRYADLTHIVHPMRSEILRLLDKAQESTDSDEDGY